MGLCVGKAKIIGCPYQTDRHPSTHHLDSTPWPVAWVLQHRRATYNDHLDTRQDGFARQGWSPDRVQRRGEGPVKGVDDGVRRLATTKMRPPLPTQPHLCNQHCHRSNSVPASFATIPVQRKWLGSTTTAAARGGRGQHGPMASLIICPLSAQQNGFGVLRLSLGFGTTPLEPLPGASSRR